jgi:hypothetical protein
MRRAALLLVLVACEPTTMDVADKISDHAGHTASRVTTGGGKFVNVEYGVVSQQSCDELQHWVRENVKQPPDCIRVQCELQGGATDQLVSYDGIWNGTGGSYPKCAK